MKNWVNQRRCPKAALSCLVTLSCAAGASSSAPPQQAAGSGPVPVVELATSDAEPVGESAAEAEPERRRSGCAPAAWIEDGEDQNNQHQLGGYWFTYVDAGGSAIEPQPGAQGGIFRMTEGGARGSRYSARAFGVVGNTEIRFAGMGFNFLDPKLAFDASRYAGVAFVAKAGRGATVSRLRVSLPDRNTDPDGGVCSECYNSFGVDLELTPEWQPYELSFSALEQAPGWGQPRPERIDSAAIYGMQFQLSDGGSFDVWLDNLRFVRCRD